MYAPISTTFGQKFSFRGKGHLCVFEMFRYNIQNGHQRQFQTVNMSPQNSRVVHLYSLTHSSGHVCVDVASRTIRLNTSLFWATLPASVGLICSHFFMSSVHLLVGRPFLLLPSSLAYNMCLSRQLCLFRWPKYDSFLALMFFNNQSWPTFSSSRISVFFLFAIHGILSILL